MGTTADDQKLDYPDLGHRHGIPVHLLYLSPFAGPQYVPIARRTLRDLALKMGAYLGSRGRPGTEPYRLLKGEYAHWQGAWHARTPNGLIVHLNEFEPIIHDDESVSTTREIYVQSGHLAWRGHLEHGVWKEKTA